MSDQHCVTTAYAIYLYDNERAVEFPNESKTEEEVQEKSNSTENIGIKTFASSLPAEQECLLQLFIIRRLRKGAIYCGTGNFSGMDFSLTEKPHSPAICFYILFPITDFHQVIICLLSSPEANLEAFRFELVHFCEYLSTKIPIGKGEDFLPQFKSDISSWYNDCINYVGRVLDAINDDISLLLQLAQQNGHLSADEDVNPKLVADVQQFLSVCTVKEYLGSNVATENVETQNGILKCGDSGSQLHIENVECNQYCKDWGQRLLELGQNSEPWKIRKILEAFKLKTVKDMNTLKRLLKQSETDHYSLYRAYTFLVLSGNSDILLKQVKLEGRSAPDVIEVLEEHLSELEERYVLSD